MSRVLLWATYAKADVAARLGEIGGNDVIVAADGPSALRALAAAEALVCQDFLWNEKVKGAAKRLKWLQLLTAGYDNAKRVGVPPGVVVTNAGESFAAFVAVHAVSLLLGLQRGFPAAAAQQARQVWDRNPVAQRAATPEGQTIAILGFGPIGREIARLLRGFGARIIAVTRSGAPHALAHQAARVADLPAVLPHADAVILALPLDESTKHLIGAKELALCKRAALLVNVARGAIVDTAALTEALTTGVIAGAGLDVTEPEPLPPDHPLWRAPNLIITPHCAGACGRALDLKLAETAGDNLTRFLAGQPLRHVVAV
jgi:phosphoglycerate dehydrogenase-like enzyme